MKHLISIEDLSFDEIDDLLRRSDYYAKGLKSGKWDRKKLQDKIVLMMFFENSTRTIISFDVAAQRLGARTISWQPENSSMQKNEDFSDTVDILGGMNPDAIIIRHSEYGAPGFVSARVNCPVINAGDSWREHPTQALLDAYTMIQHKKTLKGLRVAICGDIAHSRVANSNAILLTKMGAEVRLIAPPFLMPQKFAVDGVEQFTNMEDGLKNCDVIMMLRIQKERMEMSLIPDGDSYFREYGLTLERLKLAKKDVIVMHPGPMNRGVEIADEVADDPVYSVIRTQAANGVPVRMAVLDTLIGGEI